MIRMLTATLLLAASTAVFAQAPAGPGAGGPEGKPRPHARFDCSKAKDPKACEARREKIRAAREQALKACEGTQGDARRDCMIKQACTQAKDPARCETRMKERAQKHRQHRQQKPETKPEAKPENK